MRVATWNVNSIKARHAHLVAWLAARAPDIVCLQELKLTDEKFPHLELRAVGYHALVHGQAGWNGVAVLSRERGELLQAGLPGAPSEAGARLVTVAVQGMEVTSVYVPNGKTVFHADFRMKLDWMEALRAYVAARSSTGPALVAGDFNVCHLDLDSHSPEGLRGRIFHTTEERTAVDALLATGLVDLYRHKHPDGRDHSWWDYRAGSFHKGHGLRIDLLLGNAALAERVTDVWIDRDWRKKQVGETPSDHAPVVAELA